MRLVIVLVLVLVLLVIVVIVVVVVVVVVVDFVVVALFDFDLTHIKVWSINHLRFLKDPVKFMWVELGGEWVVELISKSFQVEIRFCPSKT